MLSALCVKASNDGANSYRAATAEYSKAWSGLHNVLELDAAAVTGNVTWAERSIAGGTYIANADIASDATGDSTRIWYNHQSYLPEEFSAVTGNFDIPVRFGATIATLWFDGRLELGASAGVNLGYQGVALTNETFITASQSGDPLCAPSCQWYADRKLGATLKLDLSAKINVTENAYIEAFADNITNSAQNQSAVVASPWVVGRTFWVGSGLRF